MTDGILRIRTKGNTAREGRLMRDRHMTDRRPVPIAPGRIGPARDREIAVPFGDLVRQFRVAAGLTQEELAARANVSVRAISDLERAKRRRPQRETLRLLADA